MLATIGPRDVGAGGFFLLLPQRRSRITNPYFPLPADASGDWVYLLDILTVADRPGPDPVFRPRDWARQYGSTWPRFRELKRRCDPEGIRTPGPGIR